MDTDKESCERCSGSGLVLIPTDSLLFEDRRVCPDCVEGEKKAAKIMEIVRKARAAEKALIDSNDLTQDSPQSVHRE